MIFVEKIINGKEIRDLKKQDFSRLIKGFTDKLKLVVIQVGNDAASCVYVRNKGKLCEEVGILFEHIKYDDISEEELITKIGELNVDDTVTGILVQLPLPEHIDEKKVIESISPLKDVDGLTSYNMGNLFSGNDSLVPCTALGVMEILGFTGYDLDGARVVIVGRSKLVGLPLVSLLLKKNATVTVCHSHTKNLKDITALADVLIVAVGKKELIKEDFVKTGAVVIDVGINRVEGKLYGDCEFESIADKCSFITPVPGGVGPLTVVMLINNVIKAYELQKMAKKV